MNAPTQLRTPVETELIERFDKLRTTLPGTAVVRERRADAFSVFERRGLPHRRVEEWKYSDLRTRLKKAAPRLVRWNPDTSPRTHTGAGTAAPTAPPTTWSTWATVRVWSVKRSRPRSSSSNRGQRRARQPT